MSLLQQFRTDNLIDELAFQRLSRFVALILQWNARINLTGFKTQDLIEERLISESILGLRAVSLAAKDVLDFGSGAGIPGLVWAICEPQAKVTSVEIRQKKAAFQKEVVRSTGISAEVIAGKFPAAVFGRRFDCIVTRAIRFSDALWTSSLPLLRPGGFFLRFAKRGETQEGWEEIPLTRDSVLLRHALHSH